MKFSYMKQQLARNGEILCLLGFHYRHDLPSVCIQKHKHTHAWTQCLLKVDLQGNG